MPPPTRCYKCAALAAAQEPYTGVDDTGKPKTAHAHSLLWEARLRR